MIAEQYPKNKQQNYNFPAAVIGAYKIAYKEPEYYDVIRESKLSFPVIKNSSSNHPTQKNNYVADESAVRWRP